MINDHDAKEYRIWNTSLHLPVCDHVDAEIDLILNNLLGGLLDRLLQLRVSDDVGGGPGIEPSAHPGQVLQHILLEVALLGEPVGDVQIIGLRGRFESKQASINDGIT